MSTTGPRSQIPLNRAMVDSKGMITVPWSFWFQSQNAGLPPAGAGYVVDGSASQVTMTLFQGLDSQKGTPQNGYIYFALDTGKTYVSTGGNWVLQDPQYTGDVTKSAGSTVLSLANVFGSPGTYGSATQTPILTVDAKGRITGLSFTTISATPTPVGLNGELQFNQGGTLGGTTGITYVSSSQSLFFTNPQATINNLSPLIAKGDIMTRDTANTTRLPVGNNDQIIIADSTANTGLRWIDHNFIANGTSNVIIPTANGNVEVNVNGNLVGYFYDVGLSVTGNVTAPLFIGDVLANVITGNTLTITGNAMIGNISTDEMSANIILANTANIVGNAIIGNVSTGELSANIIFGNTANITGNLIAGNIATDELSANIILANTANITGNVDIGGFLSVIGNAAIGNVFTDLLTANVANITGNIDIGGNINYTRTFGAFHSQVTQNSAGANATNYMSFSNTDYASGISIVSNNRITFSKAGFYNIQYSAVLQHTVNQTADVEIWLSYNGNSVPWTNTDVTVAKDVKLPVAWDWTVEAANVNDYYQIAWASPDPSVSIIAVPAANTIANVGIPSVILTVSPIGA